MRNRLKIMKRIMSVMLSTTIIATIMPVSVLAHEYSLVYQGDRTLTNIKETPQKLSVLPKEIKAEVGKEVGVLTAKLAISDKDVTYQWYVSKEKEIIKGTLIKGAINTEYTIPLNLKEGKYYYYLIAKKGKQEFVSNLSEVTIEKKKENLESESVKKVKSVIEKQTYIYEENIVNTEELCKSEIAKQINTIKEVKDEGIVIAESDVNITEFKPASKGVDGNADFTVNVKKGKNQMLTHVKHVNIKAVKDDQIDMYRLAVNGAGMWGTTSGEYANNEKVDISAGFMPGYKFAGWSSADGGVFEDASSPNTTFTMPANDVVLTINWEYTPLESYTLKIYGGGEGVDGEGEYMEGQEIAISAGDIGEYDFVGWDSDNGGEFQDSSSVNTIFTMPNGDTKLTANWVRMDLGKLYSLNMIGVGDGGTNDGEYKPGEMVSISAGFKEGYVFSEWSCEGGGELYDQYSMDTTFTMPNSNTTVTANWEKDTTLEGWEESEDNGEQQGELCNIIVIQGDNGIISPSSESGIVQVMQGDSQEFTFIPDEGYEVEDVMIDYQSIGPVTSYILEDINSDFVLEVKLKESNSSQENQQGDANEDISEDNNTMNYNSKLDKLSKEAYVTGVGENKFEPNRSITRGEVVVIFSRLLLEKMEPDKIYTSSFNDIRGDEWYANAIGYMEGFDVISGYNDGSFRPNQPITRAEFVTIASKFEDMVQGSVNEFKDVDDTHWAVPFINSAYEKGWINGYPDNTFKPNKNITRAEAVAVVNNILNREVDKEAINTNLFELTRFNDMLSSHWAYYDIIIATNKVE